MCDPVCLEHAYLTVSGQNECGVTAVDAVRAPLLSPAHALSALDREMRWKLYDRLTGKPQF
jgi:hypothetical protein